MVVLDILLAVSLMFSIPAGQGLSNSGNEFYLSFPPNLHTTGQNFPPVLLVTTDDNMPVKFTVSFNKKTSPTASGTSMHTTVQGNFTKIQLPLAMRMTFVGYHPSSGINIKAEDGKNIIVYALNEQRASTDVYLGLPYFETKTRTYTYYGVSVQESPLDEHNPKLRGYIAIVVLEDNTEISVTPTVDLDGFLGLGNSDLSPGHTSTSPQVMKGTTLILYTEEDLTGTKVSSNNPITFITGHQCGYHPHNVSACDHLSEQLPPAETFGFKFFLVPLLQRSQDGYKVVASRNGTLVNLHCVNRNGITVQQSKFTLDDRDFKQLFIHSDRFCCIEANLPLLVVQIALGHSFDGADNADPFMSMIPPPEQYRNNYTLVFESAATFKPMLSICVPRECFNLAQILFDGSTFPASITFVPVKCNNDEICAYCAQYKVPEGQTTGAHILRHMNDGCGIGVLVYAYEDENSYGYPAGMNLESLAVPNYCFKDDKATGSESSGVLKFTLQNTGVPEETCITFFATDGTATGGSDFVVENSECCFKAGEKEAECEIKVNEDSVTEGDEEFTLSLFAKEGQCVCNTSIKATISESLVAEVQFERPAYFTDEGDQDGCANLTLICNIQAPSQFDVQVSFNNGSATDPGDYSANSIVATFKEGERRTSVCVPIVDDCLFEGTEVFRASLSVHNDNLGLKVNVGRQSQANVFIVDDEEEVFINFSAAKYTCNENDGKCCLNLVASRNVCKDCNITIVPTDGSARDGSDYMGGEYSGLFLAGERKANVCIPILNDDVAEEIEEFVANIMVPEEAESCGFRQGEQVNATVCIEDNDVVIVEQEKIVNFSPTEYYVSEDGTSAVLMLMLNAPAEENCTVNVMTSEGTAEDGTDYTGGVYNVTFIQRSSKAELHIPVTNDCIPESEETFTAKVIIPDSAEGVRVGDNSSANVTITNDDDEIMVFFSPEEYMANETDGLVVITLKASRPSCKTHTVMIDTQDGTATDTDDYSGGPYPATFSPNETEVQIMIPLKNDDIDECDEDFFGYLRIPQEAKNMGVRSGDANTATVTVKDDDTFEVNFVETRMEVFEYELKIIVCLEHNRNCMEEFTVQIGNRPHPNMSATSPDDYRNGPYEVLFEKGKNRSCVDIPVIDDGVEEGPENFQLEIIPAGDGGPPFQPGPKSMAQVTLKDGNIDGDPMFTVPLNIDRKMLSKFSQKDKQWDLCYEVHGREERIYNLVSDQCVFVNTHLKMASNPKVGNIMARIGIMAMDNDGKCHKILADLNGKNLTVNGVVNNTWLHKGIIVHRFGDKVNVAVPNCKGQRMVFSIIFHYMNGADMIKFIIADGRGLSPSSHGLIGQFWDTPVEIQEVSGKQAKTGRQYKVVIYSPFTGPREFIGDYYPMTWDYQKTPCLYAGTRNGVPVIEGKFTQYEVKYLFDPKFDYSQFSQDRCSN